MRKIKIFDTTLRDGEQSPGATMNVEEKATIAKQLAKLNVDVIEAGFAASSHGDFEAVRRIGMEVDGPVICSLARCMKEDIDEAWEALKNAKKKRIHVFHSTSDIHLQYQCEISRQEALKRSVEMVKYARSFFSDVEFSPMDATRTDLPYLYEVIKEVIEAGASTVNIPDTVGCSTPDEFSVLIKGIKDNVPNINQCVISIHCHNDLGLATANSLVAIKNGAGQVHVTQNGIGERAGNAALEEIVMALRTKKDHFDADSEVVSEEITRTSKLVTKITGIQVQPNKAIVGANAFLHEAGIHQNGQLKHKDCYQFITPESVGATKSGLVLGKHSGRHALRNHLKQMGYKLSDDDLNKVFDRFKSLADKKKEVLNEDIELIIFSLCKTEITEHFKLLHLNAQSHTLGGPKFASVTMRVDSKEINDWSYSNGAVGAVFKAITKITKDDTDAVLTSYHVKNVTSDIDSQAEVIVTLERKGGAILVNGKGYDTDIVIASAKAYINALNRYQWRREALCYYATTMEE